MDDCSPLFRNTFFVILWECLMFADETQRHRDSRNFFDIISGKVYKNPIVHFDFSCPKHEMSL